MRIMFVLLAVFLIILSGCNLNKSNNQSSRENLLDQGMIQSLQWSPDGTKIAYVRDLSELWLIDVKKNKLKKVVSNFKSIYHLTWLDSSKIIFNHSDDSKKNDFTTVESKISLVDLDNGNQSEILYDSIVLSNMTSYNQSVYIGINKQGVLMLNNVGQQQAVKQIKIQNQEGKDFKISPKGDIIAFLDIPVQGKESLIGRYSLHLYNINLDKTERIDYLKSYEINNYTWSPVGNGFVFYGMSDKDKKPNIYITNLVEKTEPRIVLSDIGVAEIAWAPTGDKWIIRETGQPGKDNLSLMSIPEIVLNTIR